MHSEKSLIECVGVLITDVAKQIITVTAKYL